MTSQPILASASAETAPIGIFDSGVGGLTVLREIQQQLPNESIIYLGDTARVPYGDRSPEEILQIVREIMTWMMGQGVKMVMMACNTSSALALEQVQQAFPVPILGLICPGARAAAQVGQRIGVIATPATVASHAYRRDILEANPAAQIWQVSCPEFVPLIEKGRILDPYTRQVAIAYLQPLLDANIDTLVYGCTHYPHLAPLLESLIPSTVVRVNPAVHMVAAAVQELQLLNLNNPGRRQPTQFFVSGCPQQFAELAVRWLGDRPQVYQADFAQLADTRR